MVLVVIISLLVLIEQFWWNWWVNFAVAVGTITAVLVALFGDWLRVKLFRPSLTLSLVNPHGELTTEVLAGGVPAVRQARYYHVRDINARRWPLVTQVQVHLVRLEEPLPNREFATTWASGVPVRWKHQEIYPLQRTVGPAADLDFCSVSEAGTLSLHPMIFPNNLHVSYAGVTDIMVSLQARGNEAESVIQRYRISWDGQWEAGEIEMARHLVVREMN